MSTSSGVKATTSSGESHQSSLGSGDGGKPPGRNAAPGKSHYNDTLKDIGVRKHDKLCINCGRSKTLTHRRKWRECTGQCWQCRSKHTGKVCQQLLDRAPSRFWVENAVAEKEATPRARAPGSASSSRGTESSRDLPDTGRDLRSQNSHPLARGQVGYGAPALPPPSGSWSAYPQYGLPLLGLTGFETPYPQAWQGGNSFGIGYDPRAYFNSPGMVGQQQLPAFGTIAPPAMPPPAVPPPAVPSPAGDASSSTTSRNRSSRSRKRDSERKGRVDPSGRDDRGSRRAQPLEEHDRSPSPASDEMDTRIPQPPRATPEERIQQLEQDLAALQQRLDDANAEVTRLEKVASDSYNEGVQDAQRAAKSSREAADAAEHFIEENDNDSHSDAEKEL